MSTRNRIVLIGNGFDLAHGLKSKYEDFLHWLFIKHLENKIKTRSLSSKCDNLFEIGFVNFKSITEIEFETLKMLSISEFLEHIWIKNNSSYQRIEIIFLSTFFKEIINSKNWTDIEGAYFESLKKIYEKKKNYEEELKNLNKSFESLKKYFTKYIKLQDTIDNENFVNQNTDENNSLENNDSSNNYLDKNLNNLITICEEKTNLFASFEHVVFTSHSNFYELSLDDIYFLNFNYTGVLSRYTSFHGESFNNYFEDNVFNIHGSVNEEDTIVFGYGDEKDDFFEKMESTNIDGFLEHFKSNYYGQNGQYFNLLKVLKSPFDVIVIGHSLGLSDRLLLNTIFEHENCNYIHLQYRGDAVGHFRKRLAISRHFNDKKKLRDRLFPMIEELKL